MSVIPQKQQRFPASVQSGYEVFINLSLAVIERPRLLQPLLARISEQPVTWIQGPAGSGKSVLLHQAMTALGNSQSVATLSLTELPQGRDALQSALLALFAGLSKKNGRQGALSVVFIDDADLLLDRQPGVLEQCLDSLPATARLVLASRRALPCRQLQPSVVLSDLLLTAEELGDALRRGGQRLDTATVQATWRCTEGWPAVVALMCGLDWDDQVLTSARVLDDWFQEELIEMLDEPLLDFVRDASIMIGPLQPELLDQVLAAGTSREHLRCLADEHGLLLADEQRFPRPLSAMLRRQHSRYSPQRVHQLHQAALEMLLAQGALEAALEHAFQLGDMQLLLQLLGTHGAGLLSSGRMRSLRRWLVRLEQEGHLQSRPDMQVMLAWVLLFSNGQQEVPHVLDRLRRAQLDEGTAAALSALELTWLSMRDRVAEADEQALQSMLQVPDNSFSAGIGYCTAALVQLVLGRLQDVEVMPGSTLSALTGGGFQQAYASSVQAMHSFFLAEAGAAREHLGQARQQLVGEEERARGNSLVATLEALALYETGHLNAARALLELHLPLLPETGLVDQIILAYKLLARIALGDGMAEQAQQVLADLECLGRDRNLPRMIFSARLERVRYTLMRGDAVSARAMLQEVWNPEVEDYVQRYRLLANDADIWSLMSARVALVEADAALPATLEAELQRALDEQRWRRALTIRILLAQALEGSGHEHAARRMMEKALLFAAPRGLYQAFHDEGPGALLLAARVGEGLAGAETFIATLLPATELEQPRTAASSNMLTSRELQVLALVASGHSNEALAQQLFVSESTVRTHLRSINSKLNARSRLEALAIARDQGLITA